MKIYQLLFVLILLSLSCKKDKDTTDTNKQNEPQPDKITYHKIDNNNSIASVRAYEKNIDPEGAGDYPIPRDSSCSIQIDVNDDKINDFEIETSHWPAKSAFCTYHGPAAWYRIKVKSLNDASFISSEEEAHIFIAYDSLTTISANGTWWKPNVYLADFGVGCSVGLFIDFPLNTYIGFKINNNYGWLNISRKIELNGIAIEGYAINNTEGNPIKSGQTK